MRGVLLAGGKGTRLLPATRVMNKHMIPIGTRPMIEYPLATLRDVFGIQDILIISGGEHLGAFADYLGDGSDFGVRLTYRVQKEAQGIARGLQLAEDFCTSSKKEPFMVILGDNVFDNAALAKAFSSQKKRAQVQVPAVVLVETENASRFGVATIRNGRITTVTEKPAVPESPYAVSGLYCYDQSVFPLLKKLQPSLRGEFEISEVNARYAQQKKLSHFILDGFWSDAGTPESLARTHAWVASSYSQ
ncbi:MAG: NTP transferase domain-containing protein [Candidatus Pacebacteria bacterium]|nr:NTP transferase domain-containing protein [Candidatus Paceibacterota bacterium]